MELVEGLRVFHDELEESNDFWFFIRDGIPMEYYAPYRQHETVQNIPSTQVMFNDLEFPVHETDPEEANPSALQIYLDQCEMLGFDPHDGYKEKQRLDQIKGLEDPEEWARKSRNKFYNDRSRRKRKRKSKPSFWPPELHFER